MRVATVNRNDLKSEDPASSPSPVTHQLQDWDPVPSLVPTLFPHQESGNARFVGRIQDMPSVFVNLVEIQSRCTSCMQEPPNTEPIREQ